VLFRSFDLTDETEKMKCWNWSNMIPVPILKKVEQKHTVNLAPPFSKVVQVENIINKLEKFKEEGSTTKWFSEEYTLTKELAIQKQVN
jgi:hypothetical protein